MYQPSAFDESRLDLQHALMRAFPLATLIVAGPGGPVADLVPMMLYADEGEFGVLRAHVARANPVWRTLADAPACLVLFQGPDHYVSPGWYASKQHEHKVVPTWNYATVQARGMARVTDDTAWLRRQIDDLTASQEGRMAAPWRPSDAPADFLAATMRGIVGLELPITALAGKWKVSQNRSAADRDGVVRGLLDMQPAAEAMASLVKGGQG
jgi:transcriptional regulator